jgi:hypothetical protein
MRKAATAHAVLGAAAAIAAAAQPETIVFSRVFRAPGQ